MVGFKYFTTLRFTVQEQVIIHPGRLGSLFFERGAIPWNSNSHQNMGGSYERHCLPKDWYQDP